jgi:hypothetical protein
MISALLLLVVRGLRLSHIFLDLLLELLLCGYFRIAEESRGE